VCIRGEETAKQVLSRAFSLPSYKKWIPIGFGVGIDGFAAFLQEKARFQVLQKESFW